VDLSIILVFPFSAVMAFITLIGVTLAKRSRPRLVWPFAFSAILAASKFVGQPEMARLGFWFLGLALVAFWAAFGTVLGASVAKLTISGTRWLSR
jgi:hypothetical protein